MRFSSRTTFNDPFDSRSALVVDSSAVGLKWLLAKFAEEQPHWSPSVRLMRAKQAQTRLQAPGAADTQDLTNVLDNVGILSLTEEWDDMLMWSHYGNQHGGICIGFYTSIDFFRTAFPITYTDTFPIIQRPQDGEETILEKTLLTKASCWEYEREWRVMKRYMSHSEQAAHQAAHSHWAAEDLRVLCNQSGPGLYSYNRNAIASITLGSRITYDHARDVARAYESTGSDVPMFAIEPPSHNYKLIRRAYKI